MQRKLFFFSLIFVLALVLSGCDALQPASPTSSVQEQDPAADGERLSSADTVIVEGSIVPRDSAWLGFKREGSVAEVLVQEGQVVKAGDPLARLAEREHVDAQVEAAKLEVLSAEQNLDELNRQAKVSSGAAHQAMVDAERARVEAKKALDDLDTTEYRDQIDDAWVKVQDMQEELDDAQEEFDKYKDLDEGNSTRVNAENVLEDAQQRYDDALHEYDLLKNDLEKARADFEKSDAAFVDAQQEYEDRKNGPAADDLALAEARLSSARAQLASAEASLRDLELTAPFDGTVVRVEIAAGERVTPNQGVIQLADFSTWYVETSDLTELEVVKIDPDQPVQLAPDALADLTLTGQVERIRDDYSEKAGDVLYTVRVRLDDPDPRLRWGMTVNAEFQRK